jgi:hypothetical protein
MLAYFIFQLEKKFRTKVILPTDQYFKRMTRKLGKSKITYTFLFCFNTVLLCAYVGFSLLILLPQPLECWDDRGAPLCLKYTF